jgi:hypothetical protein
MPNGVYVNFASPVNQPILAFLHVTDKDSAASYLPEEVNLYGLGTHPDLVDYLWGLGKGAVRGCACVINQRGAPLLVHPTSGIIFGLAGGTSTLAIRLPEPELTAALAVPKYGAEYHYPSSTVYAKDMGADWALLKPFDKSIDDYCMSAFAYAATLT